MKKAEEIIAHPLVMEVIAGHEALRLQIKALPDAPAGECAAIAELRELLFEAYIGEIPVDDSPITPRGKEFDQLFLDLIEFEHGHTS